MKQDARNGVVSIIDMDSPRLEANDLILPLQELASDLYFSQLDLIDRSGAPELVMKAVAHANLWCRWLRHLNSNSLDLLNIMELQ